MQKETNKTDCSFIRNNLFSYQEKKLAEAEYREFEAHIHSCESCTLIVSEFQSVMTFMDEKKCVEPGPFIQTRILQRLENRRLRSDSVLLKIIQPISASILLLLAVIIGFSIIKPLETRFSHTFRHQNDIQIMKSGLYIPDFIEEENTLSDKY